MTLRPLLRPLSLAAVLLTAACTSVPQDGGARDAVRFDSAPGEVRTAAAGERMASAATLQTEAGLQIETAQRVGVYALQPGFYPLAGEEEDHLFYDAPPDRGCPGGCEGRVAVNRFLDQPAALRVPRGGEPASGDRSGEVCVVTIYDYRVCGEGDYRLTERAVDQNSAFVSGLVYQGVDSAGRLSFIFTEERGGLETARSGETLRLPGGTRGVVSVEAITLDIVDADAERIVYSIVDDSAEDRLRAPGEDRPGRINPLEILGRNPGAESGPRD